MYIPKQYRIEDRKEIVEFVMAHPFVTVITTKNAQPMATHVPVNVYVEGENITLKGHLAQGNPQLETFVENDKVLVISQGAHAYISSTWYEKEDVPTWNYQSVHLYGRSRLLSETELKADLKVLLGKYEGARINGATWDNLSDDTLKQIKGIVGFEIEITSMEAAYKLSQGKPEKDQETIIKALSQSKHHSEQQLAGVMQDEVLNKSKK